MPHSAAVRRARTHARDGQRSTSESMNFEEADKLVDFGFCGGETIARLQSTCACAEVPERRGVYLVARRSRKPVRFLAKSTGGKFKQRDPTVAEHQLRTRWLAAPVVLYVGKAGATDQATSLRARLHAYIQFGLATPCAHWGGRYIWQLADARELLVFWKVTPRVEPKAAESRLLSEFHGVYGQLPFANLRR
jgi:hypothetical protein